MRLPFISGRYGLAYALAAPFLLVLIAVFLGDKETPIEIGSNTFVIRPLKVALLFAVIDVIVIAILWLAGVLTFSF